MNLRHLNALGLLTLCAMIARQPCVAQGGTSSVQTGVNIALNKAYTMEPAPNYGFCTDAGDATQLTDGVYTQGHFWTQKTTVGWASATPVVITLDLQQVAPIAGVSYNTAAGSGEVVWPWSIRILTSDEGKDWYFAGDLVRLSARDSSPPAKGYAVHRFRTQALHTRGRYVRLVVGRLPYTFIDEIEVYRGRDELLAQPPAGRRVSDINTIALEAQGVDAMLCRLRVDLAEARKALDSSRLSQPNKERLFARASQLAADIEALPDELSADFRTIMPFNDVQARIFALHAPVLRSAGFPSLTAWTANRWDPLMPTQSPEQLPASPPALHVAMMRREVRADAFNLTNATDAPLQVSLNIEGMRGGTNPPYVSVREVLFTDTYVRQPIAAALSPAPRDPPGYVITVPAGLTRQVWLSFQPTEVAPGTYRGKVTLAARGLKRIELPLTFHLYPFEFPESPSISTGGWDYTEGKSAFDAAHVDQEAYIAKLREHFVNTTWSGTAPRGAQFDAEGRLIKQPDFTVWDQWISKWPGARHYAVFGLGNDFAGETPGTPRFKRMVGEWLTAWVEHMKGQGLKPSQLLILLVDEPLSPEQDTAFIPWAEAVKAAQPEVVVWEDPCHEDPAKANPRLYELSDVLCPSATRFVDSPQSYRDFFVARQRAGKELWFYSCANGKHLDPITYHRGQYWLAIRYKAKGSCYWAFGDEGRAGSSFKAYTSPGHMFSPLFLDPSGITDGKHMEAIREGVEDYEYFVMLRNRVKQLEARGIKTKVLREANDLLEEGPDRVTREITVARIGWNEPKDRSLMDQVRVQVLDMLERLTKAAASPR